MNLDIMKMEIKRLRKTLLIGVLAPVGYSALIMVFYIAFADVFNDMAGMFESASVQGLLKAFSMDSQTFSYILNYYVSYNSIYMLIMGIVFAAVITVRLFSRELKDGTYEFLYANPISRIKVFFSKASVVVIYLLVVNLLVFGVGFTSIEILKDNSPLIPWMSDENVMMLSEKMDEDPSRINSFERDDALFYQVIYKALENQYSMASEVSDLDTSIVGDLLSVFLLNPDGVFDEMLNNPSKYMVLFELEPGQEDIFKETIEAQKKAYMASKSGFKENDQVAISLFKADPQPFLQQVIDKDQVDTFKGEFAMTESEVNQVFVRYSFTNLVKVSVTTFLAMLTIVIFVMMLVVLVPHGKVTSGLATGICFIFYFLNMIGSITEQAAFLKYFTPLSYVNMDVMNVNYATESWTYVVMFSVMIVSVIVSIMSIRKSDLIA